MLDNMYSANALFVSMLISYWIGYRIARRKYKNEFIAKLMKDITEIGKSKKFNEMKKEIEEELNK